LKRTACILTLLLFTVINSYGQYYLRGEIKDEAGNTLSNAKILLHSSGYIYYSGNAGGFGIMSSQTTDSVTINIDGYCEKKLLLKSSNYEYIILKMLKATGNSNKRRLMSFTKDFTLQQHAGWSVGGETYSNLVENERMNAQRFPETGFAISIDKAAYSNIRRFLNMQSQVPPDAVRIEEMLNYFNFSYSEPPKDSVFSFEPKISSCPWNKENILLYLKVCARKIDYDKIPPANLVFLVDVSGSMDMPNRLPLLKAAFKLMVNNLRSTDTVSIVVYGGAVGVYLQPTSGNNKKKILTAIEELQPGGATPGESGIIQAYRLAKSTYIKGGNNRVILATDGDFNVGQTNEEELEKLIAQHKQSGIYLTCLGVGMGNYKDSKLEVLAKKGNGNFAYLDNEKEAEKVLVKELTQTLYTVADDAYLNIHFNPGLVKDYRLIGFDNKLAALSDTTSEFEGGEVGSGHTLFAMFELTPQTNITQLADGYISNTNLANVSVNYKCPKDSTHKFSYFSFPLQYTLYEKLPSSHRFATSVVMFGSLLKKSKFTTNITWDEIMQQATASYDANDALQKEFILIVDKAKKIYAKGRRRKGQE
jgi:Ca-activated chloride channel homolog